MTGEAVPVRTLTDADAEAIANSLADLLEQRVTKRFYEDLGRGVWSWVWRGILAGAFAFAAYSGLKGMK
jgi:hypothetical protein